MSDSEPANTLDQISEFEQRIMSLEGRVGKLEKQEGKRVRVRTWAFMLLAVLAWPLSGGVGHPEWCIPLALFFLVLGVLSSRGEF